MLRNDSKCLALAVLLALAGAIFAMAPGAHAEMSYADCLKRLGLAQARHNSRVLSCERRAALGQPHFDRSRCIDRADGIMSVAASKLSCKPPPTLEPPTPPVGYVTKVVTVPANEPEVSSGLWFYGGCDVEVSSSGVWSTGGLPTLGPSGFAGTRLPGTVEPNLDLGSLFILLPGTDPVSIPSSGRVTVSTHSDGLWLPGLFLGMNDFGTRPGDGRAFGDNEGALTVVITARDYCIYSADIGVPASDDWTDTGLILPRDEYLEATATGSWANVNATPNLSAAGFVGYLYPGQRFPDADFASLVGAVGSTDLPLRWGPVTGGYDSKYEEYSFSTSTSLYMPVGGRLLLGMNDVPGTFWDNQGDQSVSIKFPAVVR